jgi:hypothetical protein
MLCGILFLMHERAVGGWLSGALPAGNISGRAGEAM